VTGSPPKPSEVKPSPIQNAPAQTRSVNGSEMHFPAILFQHVVCTYVIGIMQARPTYCEFKS